jgi:hypothetical protein
MIAYTFFIKVLCFCALKLGTQMEEQAADDNDLPASVQDDPILSRPLQKGLMEDWLGSGIFQEAGLHRGKVRGVSEKKLKQKQIASGLQNTSRELGVACGNVKFALRVTDTSVGGKSFGDLPKGAITTQVLFLSCASHQSSQPVPHFFSHWLFECTFYEEFNSNRWMSEDHRILIWC